MKNSYTPLDVSKLEKMYFLPSNPQPQSVKKDNSDTIFNTVLLLLATITVLVVGIVFFVLIQKQVKNSVFYPGRLNVLEKTHIIYG